MNALIVMKFVFLPLILTLPLRGSQVNNCDSLKDKDLYSCQVQNFSPDFFKKSFDQYLVEYGKTYSSPAEYAKRLDLFTKNYSKILANNLNPNTQYKQSLNQFADLTDKEFHSQYLTGSLE